MLRPTLAHNHIIVSSIYLYLSFDVQYTLLYFSIADLMSVAMHVGPGLQAFVAVQFGSATSREC